MRVDGGLLASLGTDRKSFLEKRRYIVELLRRSDEAVRVAVLRIYSAQTEREMSESSTLHLNGVGFAACDARYGSFLARLMLSGLEPRQERMLAMRRMAIKYSNQLTVLAFKKEKAKATQILP